MLALLRRHNVEARVTRLFFDVCVCVIPPSHNPTCTTKKIQVTDVVIGESGLDLQAYLEEAPTAWELVRCCFACG